MDSNDCNASGGRSQRICSARILQDRQLSIMSRPYGVSTTTPCYLLSRRIRGKSFRWADLCSGNLKRKVEATSISTLLDRMRIVKANADRILRKVDNVCGKVEVVRAVKVERTQPLSPRECFCALAQ